jgi:hypothetical protein
VHANAQVNAKGELDERKWEEPEAAPPTASTLSSAPPAKVAPAPAGPAAFVGIVHDLSLTPSSSRVAACRCLAVGIGAPGDSQFAWQAVPAKGSEGTLAVAIAADGVACSAPGYAPLRASIGGVDHEGGDIVVTVENVSEGRPVMRGVLVPRPAPGGALVVRSRGGAPYGAPVNGGAGDCRIAVP